LLVPLANVTVMGTMQITENPRLIGHCRVCGKADILYLCATPNEHSKTTTIHHYRCSDCGSVFVGDDIRSPELSLAYSSLESKNYYQEIESETRKKMATAIAHLRSLVTSENSIIDIGTGNGLFVELLHKAGFKDVSAHEIEGGDLSKIRDIAQHIYRDFDYSAIPSGQFDAVTLLDVVEHVADPRYLISVCRRILKVDGVIYFHTPVVTRTDRMMHVFQKLPILAKMGAIWQRGRTSIFHLENYTPEAIRMLLGNAGFRDITIDVKNELSWPVTKYVRVYLLGKLGLPGLMAPALTPFFYPLFASSAFNANKAIVSARK
jgi:2-polyprenyl-3-methyl-5-hydroxy-6-metoxy-1,4-benzoquinol methylase